MLVVERVRSLTVFSMRRIIRIINNLPKINGIQSLRVQTLAGDVSNWDENAVAVGGMGYLDEKQNELETMEDTYASDDLWLAVADNYVLCIRYVKKGYPAHGAAKTDVFQG